MRGRGGGVRTRDGPGGVGARVWVRVRGGVRVDRRLGVSARKVCWVAWVGPGAGAARVLRVGFAGWVLGGWDLGESKRSRARRYVAVACTSASLRRTDRRAAAHSVLAARWSCSCAGRTGEEVASSRSCRALALAEAEEPAHTARAPAERPLRRNSRIVLGGYAWHRSSRQDTHRRVQLFEHRRRRPCPGTDREPDGLAGSGVTARTP